MYAWSTMNLVRPYLHIFQTMSPTPSGIENKLRVATSGTTTKEFIMSKSSGNSTPSGRTGNTSGSNLGAGRGRPSTGFPGGNWPATTGRPSGGGRGNAPAKGGK